MDSSMRGFQTYCAVASPGCQLITLYGLWTASSLLVLRSGEGPGVHGLFLLSTSAIHLELATELSHGEGRARLHRKDPLDPCKTQSRRICVKEGDGGLHTGSPGKHLPGFVQAEQLKGALWPPGQPTGEGSFLKAEV